METIKNKLRTHDNFGGIKRIYFCDMKYLSVFPNIGASGYFNIDQLVEKNAAFAANVKELLFINETAAFSQASALAENGRIFKQTVTALVAKDYNERYAALWGRDARFLVFIYDTNNVGRIIGQIEFDGSKNGAKFIDDTDTGATRNNLNQMRISFYCESKNSAYYCNPAEGDGDDYFNTPRADVLV